MKKKLNFPQKFPTKVCFEKFNKRTGHFACFLIYWILKSFLESFHIRSWLPFSSNGLPARFQLYPFFPLIIFLSLFLHQNYPIKNISRRAFSRAEDHSSCLPRALTENQYCSRNACLFNWLFYIYAQHMKHSVWCTVQYWKITLGGGDRSDLGS